MKKAFSFLMMALVAAVALVSCNKEIPAGVDREEIVLGIVADVNFAVETRATAINAVSGLPNTLYWGATTGSSTETVKYSTTGTARSSANVATGKYQTNPATAYNWYVATQTFTMSATPTMTVSNNNNDILVGRTAQSTSTTPTVALGHIFARTGSFTLSAGDGYTATATKWELKSPSNSTTGTAGTYDLKSDAWTAASARLTSYTTVTDNSDMYLIPGTYDIQVTYNLTKGDYSETGKTATSTVTLAKGKINNIVGNIPHPTGASEITIGVTVTPWGNPVDQNVTF